MTDSSDNYELFAELHQLVLASLTGEITPDEVARLEELVCSDPQARNLYVQLIHQSVDLRVWASSTPDKAIDATPEKTAAVPSRSATRPRRRSTTGRWSLAVTAVSLLVGLLVSWSFFGLTGKETPIVSNQELELETKAVVAEAQSVLDLLDQLQRENNTIVLLLGQDAGVPPEKNHEDKEST